MKPINPLDHPRLKRFFHRQRYELCEYSLPVILVWSSKTYQPCAAVIDGEALVVGAEFDAIHEDKRHLILPISPVRAFSPQELHKLAIQLGFRQYCSVPNDYVEDFGRNQVETFFEVEEYSGFHDYVYLRDDLTELRGNKYSKKRNLINQFTKSHSPERVQVERITASLAQECLDFLEKWCEERECDKSPDSDLSCERQAAKNALENIEILGMNGILLRIDGQVSAFGIASRITQDMGGLHFEKAFAKIKGLYQFFDQLCAKELFAGMTYVNKESDMDNPGLAKAKKSYHPVKIIKSYRLRVKG